MGPSHELAADKSPEAHAREFRERGYSVLTHYLRPIAGVSRWIRWDQWVAKGPGALVFTWHQDNAYDGLKDKHFKVWIALG